MRAHEAAAPVSADRVPSIEAAREFADGDPYVVAGLFARSSVTGFDLLVGPT